MAATGKDAPVFFADAYQLGFHPYGCVLDFFVGRSLHEIRAGATKHERPEGSDRVASVHLTVEHLKVITLMLWKSLGQAEKQLGTVFEVPKMFLDAANITEEEYRAFYHAELPGKATAHETPALPSEPQVDRTEPATTAEQNGDAAQAEKIALLERELEEARNAPPAILPQN